jgi:biopolymer transport protein ExbD
VARKHRRKNESSVDVTLPITPMLDMAFQMLSFFILTFHPMPTEGQLSLNLPKVDASEKAEKDPQVDTEEKKDEYVVTVISNSTGEIASLSLKGPTGDMGNIKNTADLFDRLKNLPRPQGKAELVSITIEASNDLTYARLIEIMDLSKKAGYDSVNLLPTKGG